MRYKLAIFDMDGTILDTLTDLHESLNFALTKYGFPKRSIAEVRSFVGNGILRLVELGAPKNASEKDIENIFDAFNRYYTVHCADNTKPYNGIKETICKMRRQGIKTAVVSNKDDYAVQLLCQHYFNGLFDCIVGAKDGVRKKPYADTVDVALYFTGTKRTDAVYIGDSEVDIKTAEKAKIDCISVAWGFRDSTELKKNGATCIVFDLDELIKKFFPDS